MARSGCNSLIRVLRAATSDRVAAARGRRRQRPVRAEKTESTAGWPSTSVFRGSSTTQLRWSGDSEAARAQASGQVWTMSPRADKRTRTTLTPVPKISDFEFRLSESRSTNPTQRYAGAGVGIPNSRAAVPRSGSFARAKAVDDDSDEVGGGVIFGVAADCGAAAVRFHNLPFRDGVDGVVGSLGVDLRVQSLEDR
jgi:hypothetical protein